MAEYPLLPIPAPRLDERPRGGGGGGDNLRLPTVERQARRIGPTFQRLRDAFTEERRAISLRNDPASIAPERAIVFEIAGSIGDFYAAVRQIAGLEYLGDEELDLGADDDFAVMDTRRGREGELRDDRAVGGRLYLAMPDTQALRELLRLWDLYQAGRPPERGFTSWFNLFQRLHTLRAWGPVDRIPEETINYWEEALERAEPDAMIPQRSSCGVLRARDGGARRQCGSRLLLERLVAILSTGHQSLKSAMRVCLSICRWRRSDD
jgi:hypothetical protein